LLVLVSCTNGLVIFNFKNKNMRNFISNWDWDDSWLSLAWAIAALGIVFTFTFFYADKQVRFYYLDEVNGRMAIVPDIDWACDSDFGTVLDRAVTYDQAIEMVNKLNAGLKPAK